MSTTTETAIRESAAATSAAALCREVTRRSGSSFYYAFLFLPREKREALDAVYAYCRLVDDAADEAPSPEAARRGLARWRQRVERIYAGSAVVGALPATDTAGDDEREAAVVAELRRAVRRFPIRRRDLEAVIEGCEWDVTRVRYDTWNDLRAYCERVASAVGLACMEIFGYREPGAREYATHLALALQVTNIVRDVDEDAGRGRIYLPREDLAAFGVGEEEILAGRRTEAVRSLLRFESQRARLHFARAHAAISRRQRDELVVAEIMGGIYSALLDRLETGGFRGGGRTSLSAREKVAVALRRFAASRLPALA